MQMSGYYDNGFSKSSTYMIPSHLILYYSALEKPRQVWVEFQSTEKKVSA